MAGPDRGQGRERRAGGGATDNVTESFAKRMKLESLKQRIERADYRVDADAVAAAMLAHVCERRTIFALPPLSRSGARSRGSLAGFRPS